MDLGRPDEAKLLHCRMTVLGLDVGAWGRYEPADLVDLETVCTACLSSKRCADDMLEHIDEPTWPNWRDYCPNAAKLEMLVALRSY